MSQDTSAVGLASWILLTHRALFQYAARQPKKIKARFDTASGAGQKFLNLGLLTPSNWLVR